MPGSASRAAARAGWSLPPSISSPAELLASAEEEIESREAARISMLLGRMLDHEPLTRIIGRREFWGLDFALSADTLDPRPESETVVEAVLRRVADRSEPIRVLDLGTGTGCLLLSLLSEMPAATGIGVDIASGAVATARRNAAALGLTSRAGFLVGDWAEALSARFAAVVANPPYVAQRCLVRPAVRSKPLRSLARSRWRRGWSRSLPRDRRRPPASAGSGGSLRGGGRGRSGRFRRSDTEGRGLVDRRYRARSGRHRALRDRTPTIRMNRCERRQKIVGMCYRPV